MGVSPVGTFGLTTWSASTGSTAAADYKSQIDNNLAVFQRFGTNMAVSEQTTASLRDMSVHVMPGFIFRNGVFSDIAAQDSTQIGTPVNAPRIDRIVADATSGVISVVAGTEAATPSAPALPAGTIPLAQLYLTPGSTQIGNSMLTDERIWADSAFGLPADCQVFTATGVSTWTKPPNCSTNSLVQAWLWAAGGGGWGVAPRAGGGGGGACMSVYVPAAELSATETVTVGAGAAGVKGGNTSFAGLTVYGGAAGSPDSGGYGGGGGGVLGGTTSYLGGSPSLGVFADNDYGGGIGAVPGYIAAGSAVYGGGGGGEGFAGAVNAGNSIFGGAGGAARTAAGVNGTAGVSALGGNGGAVGAAGSAPGGGGGGSTLVGNTAGGRGECRVFTWR